MSAEHFTTRRILKARESVLSTATELAVKGKGKDALAHVEAYDILTDMAKKKRQTRPLPETIDLNSLDLQE